MRFESNTAALFTMEATGNLLTLSATELIIKHLPPRKLQKYQQLISARVISYLHFVNWRRTKKKKVGKVGAKRHNFLNGENIIPNYTAFLYIILLTSIPDSFKKNALPPLF